MGNSVVANGGEATVQFTKTEHAGKAIWTQTGKLLDSNSAAEWHVRLQISSIQQTQRDFAKTTAGLMPFTTKLAFLSVQLIGTHRVPKHRVTR